MKVKKITGLISVMSLIATLFLLTINVSADTNISDRALFYTDYESTQQLPKEYIKYNSPSFTIEEEGSNHYMRALPASSAYAYDLNEVMDKTSGDVYLVNFDFRMGEENVGDVKIYLSVKDELGVSDKRFHQFCIFSIGTDKKLKLGNKVESGIEVEMGEWYSYQLAYTAGSTRLELTVAPHGGEAITKEVTVASSDWGGYTYADYDSLAFGFGTTSYIDIDNILVIKKGDKPILSDDKVAFLLNDYTQIMCSKSAVSPITKRISLDFGEYIDPESVEGNITLKDLNDQDISFTTEVNNEKVILTGVNLEPQTSYILTVLSGVANIFGDTLESDFVYNFDTGRKAATLVGIDYESQQPLPNKYVEYDPASFTIEEEGTNHYLKALPNYSAYAYELSEVIDKTSGKKYSVKFDFRMGEENTTDVKIYLAVKDELGVSDKRFHQFCIFRIGKDKKLKAGNNTDSGIEVELGKWYSYELEHTAGSSTMNLTVTPRGGEPITKEFRVENSDWGGYTYADYDSLAFGWGNSISYVDIDNILIEREVESPTLDENNIKFLAVDNTILDGTQTAVNPLAEKIELNFSEIMESESFTDNITLKDSDNQDVAFTVELNNKTVTLSNMALEPGKTYTLKVSKNVESAYGDAMENDFTYTFTIATKKVEITLDSVMINDQAVTNLSGLSDGAANLKASVSNTTEAAMDAVFVIGYYDSTGKLLDLSLTDYTAQISAKKDVLIPVTIAKPEGTAKVTVMCIDSLSNVKPLCKALYFKD